MKKRRTATGAAAVAIGDAAHALLTGTGDRVEANALVLRTLLDHKAAHTNEAATATEARLRELQERVDALAAVAEEQRLLQDELAALSAAPAGTGGEAAALMAQLAASRAADGSIAQLSQRLQALRERHAQLVSATQHSYGSAPSFLLEERLLTQVLRRRKRQMAHRLTAPPVEVVPRLLPALQVEDGADQLPTPLVILNRMAAVHAALYPHTTHGLRLDFVRGDPHAAPNPHLHEAVLLLQCGSVQVRLAFAPRWHVVVTIAAPALLVTLAVSALDGGTRLPSLEAVYRARAHGETEADVLAALAPWKPFRWCQHVCGVPCLVDPAHAFALAPEELSVEQLLTRVTAFAAKQK